MIALKTMFGMIIFACLIAASALLFDPPQSCGASNHGPRIGSIIVIAGCP